MLPAMFHYVLDKFGIIFHAFFQDYESLDFLHLVRIAHADHAAALHGWMTLQHIFDLGRVDIVAAGDYHPLYPLAEIDETFFIHHAEVSGMQPDMAVGMSAQRLAVLFFMVDVAEHHGRSGKAYLPFLAVRHLLAGAGPADLEEGVRERDADAAFLFLVVRGKAACGHALGRTVSLPDADTGIMLGKELVELLFKLHTERVSSGEDTLKARKVRSVKIFVPRDGLEEGRNACDEIRLRHADELRIALHIEPRHKYGGTAAVEHGVDADPQSESMEDRHRSQHPGMMDVLLAHGRGLKGQGIEIQIRKHDSLGDSGSSAGEEHDGLLAVVLGCHVLSLVVPAKLEHTLP